MGVGDNLMKVVDLIGALDVGFYPHPQPYVETIKALFGYNSVIATRGWFHSGLIELYDFDLLYSRHRDTHHDGWESGTG